MTNKELFDNNEKLENHNLSGKEFADTEIKGDLDILKQHVHHESNEQALDIERQLGEIKIDIRLQEDTKTHIDSKPTPQYDSPELLSRAVAERKKRGNILITTFDKKIQNNTNSISENVVGFIVKKIFRKKSLSEL